MAERIADQAQRRQALDPSESFIVQAPAGSGKTELLIQRFLTLLGMVDQPESVVAITFTRKAAAEMRHRVIAVLGNASGPEPESPHERFTWRLAQDALARNDRFDWRLTEHPSRLRIQTIDSLCAALVRQMPWVSRMGAPPQPEADATHLYRQAARRTLAMLDSAETRPGASKALERLLSHLDNNVGSVETLLSTMLGSRDQWLRHVVGSPSSEALRDELESAIRGRIEGELEQLADMFPERVRDETVELARFAGVNVVRAGRSSALSACAPIQYFPEASLGSLPHWLGIAEMFLTRKGLRRRLLGKNEGFPATDAGRLAKGRLKAIELDPPVLDRLHALRALPPCEFRKGQWEILDAMIVLLPIAVAELRWVFGQEGRVDFTEISGAARMALGSDELPTDLAFALDYRIQHLLVDEFQDTSQSQYDLLTRLIREWQPGDGRTLFLVGDPMQSIYGFREADVGLFLRARAEGLGPVSLRPLTLSVNFRSCARIVDWVNRTLSEAFPAVENRFIGAVAYDPSVPFKAESDGDAVHLYPLVETDVQAEAESVLSIIRETRANHPEGTIAVLVRARTHLFSIVTTLRRAGEKFRAVEIDALGERPVVQDLLALTRALLHPGDRVAWLSILRAPWCGLKLADLLSLVTSDGSGAIWDLVQDRARRERLSADGRRRVERIIPIVSDAFTRRGTLGVRRWVEGVWNALGGPACLERRTELEEAAAYLDLLEQSLDGLDIRDEQRFANDVVRLFAPPDLEAGEGLQLLTIHKAKGLEFDTVILPGLGRSVRPEPRKLLMWLEYMGRGQPRLLLAPIQEVGGDADPLYEYLRKVDTLKHDNESTRLLYVAATRARKHLHLVANVKFERSGTVLKPPNSRALLRKIWGTIEPEVKTAIEGQAVPGGGGESSVKAAPVGVPLRRLKADWIAPTPPREIVWKAASSPADSQQVGAYRPVFEWATELQRRVGIVVHRMLQQMQVPDRLAPSEATIEGALRAEGLDGEKLAVAVARTSVALRNAVADKRGNWILSHHEDDRREYALSTVADGRVRRVVLDRTFVEGGTRWIIDYKTGTHEGSGREAFLDNERERYRAQLEGYARVIGPIDQRPIRLGLYFPMLQGWREWAFDRTSF